MCQADAAQDIWRMTEAVLLNTAGGITGGDRLDEHPWTVLNL